MVNLTQFYFCAKGTNYIMPSKADIAEGVKWLKIAAGKGDMYAKSKLEKMESLTPEETIHMSLQNFYTPINGSVPEANPLDDKQFGKDIEQAATNESIIAERQLKIWKNLHFAMKAFKENIPEKVVSSLSAAVRLDHQIVEIPKILHSIIIKRIETHPTDIHAITCFIRINTKNPLMQEIVSKYLKMYPLDEYLIEMLIAGFIMRDDFENAEEASLLALEICPQSLRLLYIYGITLCMQNKSECLKALDKFIALAPNDHDKVPACHYRKAMYYIFTEENANFFGSFKAGLEAEKRQLPCFLPYQFPLKDMLMKYYWNGLLEDEKTEQESSKTNKANTAVTCVTPRRAEDLKNDIQRKIMITNNRNLFIKLAEETKPFIYNTIPKPPNTPKPPKLTALKSITLKEIDPTEDKVYDGYVLEAKIIDWPYVMTAISTVIEDETGDLQRLAVYNWSSSKESRKNYVTHAIKTFRPNVTVSIINPYMRMASDGKSIIRVENPVFIRLDDTLANQKCTFCGKEAKVLPCSACKMAVYCSKECQKIDWIDFNHKNVCKHLKIYSNSK